MAPRLRGAGRVLSAVLVLATGLAGCSWGPQEPGLFTTPEPSPSASPTAGPDVTPAPTNPRLPVVGETVWSTADGSGVTVRFAVHALRRTASATILDWSVTPLAGPGRRTGELLPSATDLGLDRGLAGEQDIALVDVTHDRVYRPLADVSPEQFSRCLCTPLYAVTPTLRYGDTRLLQLAFPPLPAGVEPDVVFPNFEVVPSVFVTPAGRVPVATAPVDLTRPAAAGNPVTGEKTFTAPDSTRHRQTVLVNRVVASRGLTSVVWTYRSVDAQPRFLTLGPPVSATRLDGVRVQDAVPASGPRVRLAGSGEAPTGTRWVTASYAGLPTYACLCSSLGLWSKGLRGAGGGAHLATQVGPVPAGTRRVDVLFPGLTPFTDVPVTWVDDSSDVEPDEAPGTDQTWTYDVADPPCGWSSTEWPTPLPDPAQVSDFRSRTERLLDALPGS